MRTALSSSLFLALFLSLSSCAPEQTPEVRRREDSDRAFERLGYAAGVYAGYVLDSKTEITPLSIEVHVTKNPNGNVETPILSVGLRIGLFGGVTVASTSAFFDWGANELVATFARHGASSGHGTLPGGAPGGFELKGTLKDGKISQATLIGPHLGKRDLVLEKDGASRFDTETKWNYEVVWDTSEGKPNLKGLLKVKNKSTTQEAPATSDLPYLPSLEASLVFEPFASTPENATTVLYDPTNATLDLQFTDFSWVRTTGVSLALDSNAQIAPQGRLNLGGVSLRNLLLKPIANPPQLAMLPPVYYLGTFQGSPSSIAYKAVAYLNYLGTAGVNKLDVPFPSFPVMRMELDICNSDEVFDQKVLRLDVLDHLNHRAVFHRLSTQQDPLEVYFKEDWSSLHGTFLQADPHEGGNKPKVILQPNAEVGEKGCAASP